jgi:hypothetical protein
MYSYISENNVVPSNQILVPTGCKTLVNAPKLSPSLFENVKLYPEKMERYSPVFVYGNDADDCHKIFETALSVKPANSNLWATFRGIRTDCVLRIGLYVRN